MTARLFIRNDDVWTVDRQFRWFFDLSIDRGIPVVHAVIPARMDQGLVRFLRRAKEKTPHLLDIVQHGWLHANHSLQAGKKYEFGVSRDYETQQKDIQQGLQQMRHAFGELWTPAFVPPYHGYDEHTLKVVHEEGFKIFSAGARKVKVQHSFIDIPAEIWFNCYEPGKPRVRSLKEVMGELAQSIYRRPLSGVLTHHAEFKGAVFRKELTGFFDYMAALRKKEQWRVLLFSDMLKDN